MQSCGASRSVLASRPIHASAALRRRAERGNAIAHRAPREAVADLRHSARQRRDNAAQQATRRPIVLARHDARESRAAGCDRDCARATPRAAPACTGCAGAVKISGTAPVSMIWPAYITTTRCAVSATTARSWVISSKAMPRSRCRSHQQLQHLRLDRDVERRRRLVGDQQLRRAGDGHRDHDPLRHAARKLVRIGVEPRGGIGDLDLPQQRERAAADARTARARPPCRGRASVSPIW